MNEEKYYKPSEVAALFEVTEATVREWLRDGTLTGLKIGKGHYWRVPYSSLRKFGESRHGN